jgi:hypothetical protein
MTRLSGDSPLTRADSHRSLKAEAKIVEHLTTKFAKSAKALQEPHEYRWTVRCKLLQHDEPCRLGGLFDLLFQCVFSSRSSRASRGDRSKGDSPLSSP